MVYLELKGFWDSFTNSWEKGHLGCVTNFWTPCSWSQIVIFAPFDKVVSHNIWSKVILCWLSGHNFGWSHLAPSGHSCDHLVTYSTIWSLFVIFTLIQIKWNLVITGHNMPSWSHKELSGHIWDNLVTKGIMQSYMNSLYGATLDFVKYLVLTYTMEPRHCDGGEEWSPSYIFSCELWVTSLSVRMSHCLFCDFGCP